MKDIANATKRLVSKKNQGKLCEKGECYDKEKQQFTYTDLRYWNRERTCKGQVMSGELSNKSPKLNVWGACNFQHIGTVQMF